MKNHKDLERVRTVSRMMAGLCTVGMIGLPAGLAWLWLDPIWLSDAYPAARLHLGDPNNWPAYLPFAGFAITLLPASVLIYGLDQLRRLFKLYARGEIFSPEAARRLKRFAATVLAQFLLRPITGAALSILLTAHNPPGKRALTISLGSPEFGALVLGGLILVIGWVMGESARIAEENKGFV